MAKLKIEDIKKDFESRDWTLVSEEYHNLNSELEVICPKGHNAYVTYASWRTHHKCPICEKEVYIDKGLTVLPKKSKVYRVVGLDAATHTTGYSLFDDNTLIKFGLFKINEGSEIDRLVQIKNWLACLIQNWKPDLIVIEDIHLQENNGFGRMAVTTFKTLAKLQGILEVTCRQLGVDYLVVHSSVWREYNEIKGRSRQDKKRSAQLRVKDIYGLELTDDAAEAICIGRYGAGKHKTKIEMIEW